MFSPTYKAARNLRIVGGLFLIGCAILAVSWWFGFSPVDRLFTSEAYILMIAIDALFSGACFVVAACVEANRTAGFAFGALVGVLALVNMPVGLLNLLGATILIFVGQAWWQRRKQRASGASIESPAQSPDTSDASERSEPLPQPAHAVRASPPVAILAASVVSFIVGVGAAAVVKMEALIARGTSSHEFSQPVFRETVGRYTAADRFYMLAADAQVELRELRALRNRDFDGATTQLEADLHAKYSVLSPYADVVPNAEQKQFVTDVIAELRRYRQQGPVGGSRTQ
jgi:hypothetical protein